MSQIWADFLPLRGRSILLVFCLNLTKPQLQFQGQWTGTALSSLLSDPFVWVGLLKTSPFIFMFLLLPQPWVCIQQPMAGENPAAEEGIPLNPPRSCRLPANQMWNCKTPPKSGQSVPIPLLAPTKNLQMCRRWLEVFSLQGFSSPIAGPASIMQPQSHHSGGAGNIFELN